jgi:hypothetical protein
MDQKWSFEKHQITGFKIVLLLLTKSFQDHTPPRANRGFPQGFFFFFRSKNKTVGKIYPVLAFLERIFFKQLGTLRGLRDLHLVISEQRSGLWRYGK